LTIDDDDDCLLLHFDDDDDGDETLLMLAVVVIGQPIVNYLLLPLPLMCYSSRLIDR
jgi:hypothetical protein